MNTEGMAAEEFDAWFSETAAMLDKYGDFNHEWAIIVTSPQGSEGNRMRGLLDSLRLLAARSDSLRLADPSKE